MQRTFQQIFKELRQEKGLTQAQLAERLNYTQGNISGWEKGTVEPKATALTVIAEFFGVSIEYLLGVTDEFNTPVAPMGGKLTASEKELLSDFRKLSPYLQGIAINTVRGLTGAGAGDLHKKA